MSEVEEPELRHLLVSLYAADDHEQLNPAIARNIEAINHAFHTWTKVPEEIRSDPNTVDTWMRALLLVARVMQMAGYPGPMAALSGRADNPIARWDRTFLQAERQAAAGEYAASTQALTSLLDDTAGARGNAIDQLLPKVYGLLGTNAIHLGDVAASIAHTDQARQLCAAIGDEAGVAIYTTNLELARLAEGVERADPETLRMVALRKRIAEAQDLSDGAQYHASNEILEALVPEGLHLVKIHGLLGLNLYRLGSLHAARTHTERALAEARRTDDVDAIRVYTANLATIVEAGPTQGKDPS